MTFDEFVRRLLALRDADPDVSCMRIALGPQGSDVSRIAIESERETPLTDEHFVVVIA